MWILCCFWSDEVNYLYRLYIYDVGALAAGWITTPIGKQLIARSLSDLPLTYCEKAGFGHFL